MLAGCDLATLKRLCLSASEETPSGGSTEFRIADTNRRCTGQLKVEICVEINDIFNVFIISFDVFVIMFLT